MRQQPLWIGRIAVKTETDMIENATETHFMQRLFNHLQGLFVACALPIAQQKGEIVWRGKFGRGTKPAVCFIKSSTQLMVGCVQDGFGQLFSRLGRTVLLQEIHHLLSIFQEFVALVFP